MTFDWNSLIIGIVSSGVLVTIVNHFLNKREREQKSQKDNESSIVEDTKKIREVYKETLNDSENYWKERFKDHEQLCHEEKERLRHDLAVALVENEGYKIKLAELNGYIKGATEPLIQMNATQKAALSRRVTDKE